MEIIYEKNYINRCNQLKIIRKIEYVTNEEYNKNYYARLNHCMKKVREKFNKLCKERMDLFSLIQYCQLKILTMLEDGIDEKVYEFRRLKELTDMKIVELKSLDREINAMKKQYPKL